MIAVFGNASQKQILFTYLIRVTRDNKLLAT